MNKTTRTILLLAMDATNQLDNKTLEQIRDHYFPDDSISTISRAISELSDIRLELSILIDKLLDNETDSKFDPMILLLTQPDILDQQLDKLAFLNVRVARIAAALHMDPKIVCKRIDQYFIDFSIHPNNDSSRVSSLLELLELARLGQLDWNNKND